MRLIADEMVSPKIVRVVSETVLTSGWKFDSVITANLNGRADEDWIAAFARAGGNAIISADQKMLKRETLVRSIAESGLIGIYLPPYWAGSRRDQQLAYFLHWWVKIEKQIQAGSSGSAWIVPKGLSGGELREHKVTRINEKKQASATKEIS